MCLPDATLAVINSAVTHESYMLGTPYECLMSLIYSGFPEYSSQGNVAYGVIIEDCKEIQGSTLCCTDHALFSHEPLINLS